MLRLALLGIIWFYLLRTPILQGAAMPGALKILVASQGAPSDSGPRGNCYRVKQELQSSFGRLFATRGCYVFARCRRVKGASVPQYLLKAAQEGGFDVAIWVEAVDDTNPAGRSSVTIYVTKAATPLQGLFLKNLNPYVGARVSTKGGAWKHIAEVFVSVASSVGAVDVRSYHNCRAKIRSIVNAINSVKQTDIVSTEGQNAQSFVDDFRTFGAHSIVWNAILNTQGWQNPYYWNNVKNVISSILPKQRATKLWQNYWTVGAASGYLHLRKALSLPDGPERTMHLKIAAGWFELIWSTIQPSGRGTAAGALHRKSIQNVVSNLSQCYFQLHWRSRAIWFLRQLQKVYPIFPNWLEGPASMLMHTN